MKRWSAGRSWGFTDADFASLEIPSEPKLRPFAKSVLVPYLYDVATTFEELASVADHEARVAKVRFYAAGRPEAGTEVQLRPGIEHPVGLRWELIDLRAHWRCGTPAALRDLDAPHAGILAALAHFPGWVSYLISSHAPPLFNNMELALWLPGYRTNQDRGRDRKWWGMPAIRHGMTGRYGTGHHCVYLQTWLDETWSSNSPQTATPEFVRPKRV